MLIISGYVTGAKNGAIPRQSWLSCISLRGTSVETNSASNCRRCHALEVPSEKVRPLPTNATTPSIWHASLADRGGCSVFPYRSARAPRASPRRYVATSRSYDPSRGLLASLERVETSRERRRTRTFFARTLFLRHSFGAFDASLFARHRPPPGCQPRRRPPRRGIVCSGEVAHHRLVAQVTQVPLPFNEARLCVAWSSKSRATRAKAVAAARQRVNQPVRSFV